MAMGLSPSQLLFLGHRDNSLEVEQQRIWSASFINALQAQPLATASLSCSRLIAYSLARLIAYSPVQG